MRNLFVLFVLRGRKGWNKDGERVERVILEEKEKKWSEKECIENGSQRCSFDKYVVYDLNRRKLERYEKKKIFWITIDLDE